MFTNGSSFLTEHFHNLILIYLANILSVIELCWLLCKVTKKSQSIDSFSPEYCSWLLKTLSSPFLKNKALMVPKSCVQGLLATTTNSKTRLLCVRKFWQLTGFEIDGYTWLYGPYPQLSLVSAQLDPMSNYDYRSIILNISSASFFRISVVSYLSSSHL